MEAITELFGLNYQTILLGFFAILVAVKEFFEIRDWYKQKFGIKTAADEAKESIEERIAMLEKHDKWQYEEITKIANGIEDIKKSQAEIKEAQIDTAIKSYRWEILDFSSGLVGGRKYNRETFNHIYDVYGDYEDALEATHKTNGFIDDSMKIISEYYKKQCTENLNN